MSFVRNLVRDLVDKKLWPVAAALLVALAAVPVLVGGGSSAPAPKAPEPKATAAGSNPVATTARVSLDSSTPAGKRHRRGAVRNPFVQQHQPKKATDATSAAGTAAGSAGSAGSAGKGSASLPNSGTTTPGNTSPDVKTPAPVVTRPVAPRRVAPSVAQRRVYRVAVRFGETGGVRTRHDAARLTALPSTSKPMVLFLGVRSDAKTAVFLLAPGVVARGDGWCRPKRAKCNTLEMRAGDREVLEMATGTAGIVQYHLVVARVAKRTLKSTRLAARKHKRLSKAGRELLWTARDMHVPGARTYRYDPRYGVLRAR